MEELQRDGPHQHLVQLHSWVSGPGKWTTSRRPNSISHIQPGAGPSSEQLEVLFVLSLCEPRTLFDHIKERGSGSMEIQCIYMNQKGLHSKMTVQP